MMLRVLKTMDYNGRRLKAGEMFEPASAGDGRVLVLAQLAAMVDDDETPSPPKKKRYNTRRMRAEDE